MTTTTNNWSTLDESKWAKVISSGDILVANDLLTSTGTGNYLVYVQDTDTGATVAATTVTLSTAHGYTAAEQFIVVLEQGGVYEHRLATAVLSTTFTVASTAFAGAINVSYNKKTTALTAEQRVDALVLATAQGATNSAIIWSRFSVNGAPASSLRAGYGAQLVWDAAGVRTLNILKINPTTGAFDQLATTTDFALETNPAGADFETNQWLRLIVSDEASVAGSPPGVRIRAYVNRDDVALPTLEWVDRGSGNAPLHRGGGTWALTFGTANQILFDALEAADGYVFPAVGAGRAGRRTLADYRTIVDRAISRGPVSNLDADEIDQAINDSVQDLMDYFGLMIEELRHLESFTLTSDSDRLVPMAYDVDQVHEVYDATSKEPVAWRWVADSEGERQRRIYLLDEPSSGRSYLVDYTERWQLMEAATDECPLDRTWDELVALGAQMRMVDNKRDPQYAQALERRYARRRTERMARLNRKSQQSKPRMEVIVPSMVGYPHRNWQRRGPF